MNLSDMPTVEVLQKKRDDALTLIAKYEANGAWVFHGQDQFDPDFVTRIKLAVVTELKRVIAESTAKIAELGVKEDQ